MRQGKAASISLFLYLLTITIKFTDVFCHKTISCRSTSFLFVCFIHHFTVCPYVRMSFLLPRLSESKDAFQITRDVILRKYPRWIFRLGTAGVSFLRTTVRHMWTILKCCLLCQMFACMYQSGDCVCVCVCAFCSLSSNDFLSRARYVATCSVQNAKLWSIQLCLIYMHESGTSIQLAYIITHVCDYLVICANSF